MKIEVQALGENFIFDVSPGARLLDYLREKKVYVNAACGGKGTCNKCRVKVSSGFASIQASDRKAFSEEELREGWRLSCQATPRTNLKVIVPNVENLSRKAKNQVHEGVAKSPPYSLVCDLGSTGMVMALINASGNILVEAHLLNRQVKFGADVMTRLQYAQENSAKDLREALVEGLGLLKASLHELFAVEVGEALSRPIFISGNSAMTSFLMGWSTEELAVSPFQPLKRSSEMTTLAGGNFCNLPLLGGFVGGDTFAGLSYLESLQVPAPWMLVDIGTNTEILLKNNLGEYFFASAPAGPAFEGGNITFGMRAENGAISHAVFTDKWQLETIGNDQPQGICGSGLIDLIDEAVDKKLIEEDGFVPKGRLIINHDISLLADDIREFQLAKSATRTAIDIVANRAGVRPAKIYLAGTFAEHLNLTAVTRLGLLPPDIPIECVGNASLKGTIAFALMPALAREQFLAQVEKMRRPIELALQDDFQDAFVRNLALR